MRQLDLLKHTDTVNELLARYGVKFGIYKNNEFKEQLFPFDAIPRIIAHEEFLFLERGLKQRVMALNLFIKDIYSKKQIVKDGIVPEDFILPRAAIWRSVRMRCHRGAFMHIFPELIWSRERMGSGTFWRTICGCLPGRLIR